MKAPARLMRQPRSFAPRSGTFWSIRVCPPSFSARLNEHAGVKPDQIDAIFLTNSRPAHRGGLSLFTKAKIFIHELEQEFALHDLRRILEQAPDEDIDRAYFEAELKLIETFQPAPDKSARASICFHCSVTRPARAACSFLPPPQRCSSPAMPCQHSIIFSPARCCRTRAIFQRRRNRWRSL